MSEAILQVPIDVPTAERFEAIWREECAKRADRREMWLTLKEAGVYLRMSRDSLNRKRKKCGLPVFEIDGCLRFWRPHLDEMMDAHRVISGGGSSVIQFSSVTQKKQPPTASADCPVLVQPKLAAKEFDWTAAAANPGTLIETRVAYLRERGELERAI